MAVNKSKLPKPKAVNEAVITKDAFLALIRKYKNTSVAAAALVLALTSFMGISAFKIYSTRHDHPEGVKGVRVMNYHKDARQEVVAEVPSSASAPGQTRATAAVTGSAQLPVNSPGKSAFSSASPNATLPSQPNSSQLDRGNNCTFIHGFSENKVCAPATVAY